MKIFAAIFAIGNCLLLEHTLIQHQGREAQWHLAMAVVWGLLCLLIQRKS